MSFSAQNCPIICRNSRKFRFLFFISLHKTVRQKLFSQKTFPICSRRSCRNFRANTCSYEKLEASSFEAFPYFAPLKWSKVALQSSKSRKLLTSGKNFFYKSCSYNLPLKVLFSWASPIVKSEITKVEKVEKHQNHQKPCF